MNYDTFVDLVQQRARVPAEKAVDLTRATLETLAERITGGEALDLAAQLPMPLASLLDKSTEAVDRFGADEFVRRVEERAAIDEQTARNGIRVVLVTLREAVTGGEFDEVMSQLPDEFEDLFSPLATPGGSARRQ
jgi:uncharacterized protein (DUF2267 family)